MILVLQATLFVPLILELVHPKIKNHKTMKNIFIIIISIILSLNLTAQVIFSEDFQNGFSANNWEVEAEWQVGNRTTASSQDFSIPAHTFFAVFNDDILGLGNISAGSIISPKIDISAYDEVLLSFDAYFINGDYEGDETAKVLIRHADSTNWLTLHEMEGDEDWQTINLYLERSVFGDNIQIAFAYDDGGGWNYGYCVDNIQIGQVPDFLLNVQLKNGDFYTKSTPRQLTEPLEFIHVFDNIGTMAVSDMTAEFIVKHNFQTVFRDTFLMNTIPANSSYRDTFRFMPTELGKYTFQFKMSHEELGTNFYLKVLINYFELTETELAKDDGERDAIIGFVYGDPNWYGYYGSEFRLFEKDTLEGISAYMSSETAGTYNLTVNAMDETGIPNVELFHSDPIPIPANTEGWAYFELPSELILQSGNYVFAVGQDTIQGVLGHGFDVDTNNEGYWITSPVAGGGYPWLNLTEDYNPTLMIRPHFRAAQIVSDLNEIELSRTVNVYPNPTQEHLTIALAKDKKRPNRVKIFTVNGKKVIDRVFPTDQTIGISHLAAGVYFLQLEWQEGIEMVKIIKH